MGHLLVHVALYMHRDHHHPAPDKLRFYDCNPIASLSHAATLLLLLLLLRLC